MSKRAKLDPKLQADINLVADTFANGISGFIQVGLIESLKMKGPLENIMKSKAGIEAFASVLAKFIEVNPRASEMVDIACSLSPKLRELLEKLRLKPKDIQPEDVEVREEKEG